MNVSIQPDRWPLKRGDTLSNHDWFPFHGHQFLGSRFLSVAVMEGRRADVATAVILWAEAMRQDPGGTLPNCDIELASLARFRSVEEWQQCRTGVLYGWEPVEVEDARDGKVLIRLGHPGFMQQVVEGMIKRKHIRDGAREAARLAVKKTRIRKKMEELQIARHIINDENVVRILAEYFVETDLYITPDNLRAAMAECIGFTGDVAQFPTRKGPA